MKQSYFSLKQTCSYRCWRFVIISACAMLVTLAIPNSLMGQGNQADITGNILGIAPVKAPHNGTSIDGNAYAYWRDQIFKVPDLSTLDPTDSLEFNFNNFGDIFYWGTVYPPDGDEIYPNDPEAGVLDVIRLSPGTTPADFTAAPHNFTDVEDDTVVVYVDGIGNQDLTGFHQSTKMNEDPKEWHWKATSSPQKDDMQNCGALFTWGDPNLIGINGLPGDSTELWCAFAADRKSVKGVSWISFEFLQNPMYMTTTGTDSKGNPLGEFISTGPDSGRTVNDIIVFVGLFNGGDQADVRVNRWEWVESEGEYQYVEILSSKDAPNPADGYPYGSILATVNTEETPIHFPAFGQVDDFLIGDTLYTLPYYEINQWCEGAINLSALFDLDEDPCFTLSTCFISTRTSSESTSSELKDFVAPIQVNITADPPKIACGDVTIDACTPRNDIIAAYESWQAGDSIVILDPGTVMEGDPGQTGFIFDTDFEFPTLPEGAECGFSTSYWFIYSDYCGNKDSVECTFAVTAAPDLSWTEPADSTISSCAFADQAAVNTAFSSWLTYVEGVANVGGGCDPMVTNDATTAPDLCVGDSRTVTWTITDLCDTVMFDATYTVMGTDTIMVSCKDTTLLSCDVDIDAAYVEWMNNFTYTGGCVGQIMDNINEIPAWADSINPSTGGSVTFTYAAWDNCTRDEVTCTFVVPPCAPTCNTIYAFNNQADSESIECFLENGYSNWGWSNKVMQPLEGSYVGTWPLYAGNPDCAPITDPVGEVTITYAAGGTLTVDYEMFGDHYLTEAHVNVGCNWYAMKKNGSPTISPGQYNYGGNTEMATSYSVEFPEVSGDVWVIVHGVSCYIEGYTPDPMADGGTYNGNPINCPVAQSIEIAESQSATTSNLKSANLKVYPNPFSETVTFEFKTHSNAHATLEISNLLGQKVATLLDGPVEKGVLNRIEYTPVNETPGMLIYRLIINESAQTGRIIYKE